MAEAHCPLHRNTYIDEIDVRVPGLSRGLSLNKVWNSRLAYSEGMWKCGDRALRRKLFVGNQNYIDYWKVMTSIWSSDMLAAIQRERRCFVLDRCTFNAGATLQWRSGDDRRNRFER